MKLDCLKKCEPGDIIVYKARMSPYINEYRVCYKYDFCRESVLATNVNTGYEVWFKHKDHLESIIKIIKSK